MSAVYYPAGVPHPRVPCDQYGVCPRRGLVCLYTRPQLLWQAGRGAGTLDLPAADPGARLLSSQGDLS